MHHLLQVVLAGVPIFIQGIYTRRFLKNAIPEPDFRYFSNLNAEYLLENAMKVIRVAGRSGLVDFTRPSL